MYPANSHVVRGATAADEYALRRIAKAAGRSPLEGRIVVAEVSGVVAAAVSRDDDRAIIDHALAPHYLTPMLRARASGTDAYERQANLSERLREAVLGPRSAERLARAA
jgi:hypothetical protein